MELIMLKRKASVAKMSGKATVDGVLVAEAEVMCKLADKLSNASASGSHCRSLRQKSLRPPRSARIALLEPALRSGPTRLMANVYVEGPASIGEDNLFYPYSTVGVAPQDLKYKGEPSKRA